jgi:cation:H+ antiporter
MEALLSGLSIFGAAFVLSWAAELAELEIPSALALAFLALVAVLPEYAVDMYFAWVAGKDPQYVSYATANMTGANRLLIGLGWSSVVLFYWLRTRKPEVVLGKENNLEIRCLLIATLYSFLLPIKGTLSLLDSVFFLALFVFYMFGASHAQHREPELEGPSALIAFTPRPLRRGITVLLFVFAGLGILVSAEPFAEGLLATGRRFEIEEFILVQWLAPLASESPEFIIAILFALKGNPAGSMTTLISSKVNQWTLLVGMLPMVYSVSSGGAASMHLDPRQVEEILLTSAQSLFAVAVLANLSFNFREALLLAVLFVSQLFFPSPEIRYGYSAGYAVLTLVLVLASRSNREALAGLFSLDGLLGRTVERE